MAEVNIGNTGHKKQKFSKNQTKNPNLSDLLGSIHLALPQAVLISPVTSLLYGSHSRVHPSRNVLLVPELTSISAPESWECFLLLIIIPFHWAQRCLIGLWMQRLLQQTEQKLMVGFCSFPKGPFFPPNNLTASRRREHTSNPDFQRQL